MQDLQTVRLAPLSFAHLIHYLTEHILTIPNDNSIKEIRHRLRIESARPASDNQRKSVAFFCFDGESSQIDQINDTRIV